MLHDQLINTFKTLAGTLDADILKQAHEDANTLLSIGDFSERIHIPTQAAALFEYMEQLKQVIDPKHKAAHRSMTTLLQDIKRFQESIPSKGCCLGWGRAWAACKTQPDTMNQLTLEHIVHWQLEAMDFLPISTQMRDAVHQLKLKANAQLQTMRSPLLMFSRQGQAVTQATLSIERIKQQLALIRDGQCYMLIMRNATEGHALTLRTVEGDQVELFDSSLKEIRLGQPELAQALLDKVQLYSANGLHCTDIILHPLNVVALNNRLVL